MQYYNLIMHILHIGCAVFWGGTIIFLHFFVFPAARNAGPEGGKILGAIMNTRKLPLVMSINGTITILAGIALMDHLSGHFSADWFSTHLGMTLSAGAILGLTAFFIGIFYNKPAANKMEKLVREIGKDGKPNEAQAATMMQLRGRLMNGTKWIAWLVILTVFCMTGAHFV